MRRTYFFCTFLGLVLTLSACDFGVNKSIYVKDGETKRGSINTVNGNISIGKECTVTGSSRTVNGRIEVGKHSRVEDLQSVNGSVEVQKDVDVDGDIEVVNGPVLCDKGTRVHGSIQTVNGEIELQRTVVEKDITTVNGDIVLSGGSRVKGDIRVGSKGKSSGGEGVLRITISDDSVVDGDIVVEDTHKKVTVVLSRGGQVLGEIKGADVVRENDEGE